MDSQNQRSQYAQAQATICVPKCILVQVNLNPPLANLTAFNNMVNKMEELGLWLTFQYPAEIFLEYHRFHIFLRDTIGSYMNLTSVTEQVMQLRNWTNVLLCYTADEPDGSEGPFSAPASASPRIRMHVGSDARYISYRHQRGLQRSFGIRLVPRTRVTAD